MGSITMTLAELIAKLEVSHDRGDERDAIRYHRDEYNAAIATAIWGEPRPTGSVAGPRTLVWWHHGFGREVAPDFVGSIDVALTLVPPGWVRSVDATYPAGGIDVDLFLESEDYASVSAMKARIESEIRGTHQSEAVATCIAALKARALGDHG
jgi:hypothetical protein